MVIHPPFDDQKHRSLPTYEKKEVSNIIGINLSGKRIILSVSRLVKRKGIDLAIRGLNKYLTTNPSWIYLIAGSGPEDKYIKSLVTPELKDRIIFLGQIDNRLKRSLFKLSEIFILPVHSDQGKDIEGFGISYIEASFHKNLVIGGMSGGATEAVRERHSGFLLDFDQFENVGTISEILLSLDDEDIENYGERGEEYVLKNFSSEVTRKKIERILRFAN